MFEPGDKVGDYEIVAKLKSGGMATLFLGRRLGAAGFAKHVAIKVVHEHLAEDPSFVRMFVDEALLSARISHPNVVHVEELREREGRHFLVMEYVRGVSLWQLLATLAKRSRRMNPEVAVYIAVKVADGLHAAHETRGGRGELLGVVHRDISPQNVLLSYQGNVKLIDFGVAKARGRLEETSGGSIKGKFRYMSPEQAWGRAVDRRSDIYSLGVVLWEMLTMRRRFETKDDALILDLVRHPEPVPPSQLADGVSAALDAVVVKAQATRPEDRYQSAQELRAALLRAMPGAAILHESQLGSLLRQVMADHIDKEAARLPQSVGGLTHDLGEASNVADRPIATMTISDVDVELVEEQTDTSDPSGASASGLETPSSSGARTPATPAVVPAQPPRSDALLFLAIAAVLVAAGLFGVVIALGAHLADDGDDAVVRPTSVGSSSAPTGPPSSAAVPGVDADARRSADADARRSADADSGSAEATEPEPETASREDETRPRPDGERRPPRMRRGALITDMF